MQNNTDRFWMVFRDDASGTVPKKKHPTIQEAIAEAGRLAYKHHGSKFFVLESLGFSQKVVPSTFTWVDE